MKEAVSAWNSMISACIVITSQCNFWNTQMSNLKISRQNQPPCFSSSLLYIISSTCLISRIWRCAKLFPPKKTGSRPVSRWADNIPDQRSEIPDRSSLGGGIAMSYTVGKLGKHADCLAHLCVNQKQLVRIKSKARKEFSKWFLCPPFSWYWLFHENSTYCRGWQING